MQKLGLIESGADARALKRVSGYVLTPYFMNQLISLFQRNLVFDSHLDGEFIDYKTFLGKLSRRFVANHDFQFDFAKIVTKKRKLLTSHIISSLMK